VWGGISSGEVVKVKVVVAGNVVVKVLVKVDVLVKVLAVVKSVVVKVIVVLVVSVSNGGGGCKRSCADCG
jgi:hypothetical protein